MLPPWRSTINKNGLATDLCAAGRSNTYRLVELTKSEWPIKLRQEYLCRQADVNTKNETSDRVSQCRALFIRPYAGLAQERPRRNGAHEDDEAVNTPPARHMVWRKKAVKELPIKGCEALTCSCLSFTPLPFYAKLTERREPCKLVKLAMVGKPAA